MPLCKVAYAFRLVPLFVSFQPFTDKVANNTCQYGDNECDNLFQRISPPSCRRFAASLYYHISPYYTIKCSILDGAVLSDARGWNKGCPISLLPFWLLYTENFMFYFLFSVFVLHFSGQYKNIPHSGNTGNTKPLLS